ncbi:hypothetical protein LTR36_004796 [Oleoguttula mirabilis]|uniref:Uncharacterized protein n=1 Tax=Oleoguttula mirabilis TaxID=1507867 RepID=A0AAV9JFS3_9PEZI|nr:hypothetical protein LTR36_004796 [Oleoguttula mirabilis]
MATTVPTYALPLDSDDLDAHRWIAPQPGQTAEQRRQAECEAQPTIGQCLRAPDGRRRGRPPVPIPDGRPPNSFDDCLDLRQGDLAGGRVGFWDYDRDAIEQENTFEEPEDFDQVEELHRTASPWPEDPRSIEGMFSGSLSQDVRSSTNEAYQTDDQYESDGEDDGPTLHSSNLRAVARRLLGLPADIRLDVARRVTSGQTGWFAALRHAEERFGWLETGGEGLFAAEGRATGLRDYEVREVARRLYNLPHHWRERVLQRVDGGDMGWTEALDMAVEHAWWDRLTPRKQDVFRRVRLIEELVRETMELERSKKDSLSLEFKHMVFDAWDEMDDPLHEYFRPLIEEEGQEIAFTEDGRPILAPFSYWWFAITEIDESGFEEGGLLHKVHGYAMLKVINYKRMRRAEELYKQAFKWIDSVGDLEIETEGLERRGDFWHIHILLWQGWEALLFDPTDIGLAEASNMTTDQLQMVITEGRTVEETEREIRAAAEAAEAAAEPAVGWGAEVPEYGQPVEASSVRW